MSAVDDLTDIPRTFGIPVETVDGRDPEAVFDVVSKGVAHTRARKGPFFVHVATARYAGTQPLWPTLPTGETDISMAWDDSGISGEHEQWYREHDPVLGYARKPRRRDQPGRADRARSPRACASAWPRRASSRSTARGPRRNPHSTTSSPEEADTMATKNYADAMLDVLTMFMGGYPNFVVMGNEVLGIGPEAMQFGPFQEKYGDRVYFPPCSEAAYSALAAGAAMCGQRMFLHLGLAPFAYPAFSSPTIASEVSTARQGSGGRVSVPATFHMSHGLLHGGASQHSESPMGMFWNVAGIEIAVPWGPADLKGLLTTALRSDNPSLVITHAFGYGAEEDVPDGDYALPLGEAAVKREGSDVTIVACSMMVVASLEAAETLAGEGIDAEVIDLRTLVPLDERAILDSVAKTGHVVITDEGRLRCGVASEIAATVAEHGFESLKAPPARVARLDAPVPGNQIQEAYIAPSAEKIVAAAKQIVGEVPAHA